MTLAADPTHIPALSHQPQRSAAPDSSDDLTADTVRAISVNTLYLVSTTVDRMSDVSVQAVLACGP